MSPDPMLQCHSWIYGSQASLWEKLEPPGTKEEREGEEEVGEEK